MRDHVLIICLVSLMLVVAGCGGGQDNNGNDSGSGGPSGSGNESETTNETGKNEDGGSKMVDEAGDDWVQVSGTVVLKGKAPESVDHEPKEECDLAEGQKKITLKPAEVGENGGLQDVFVWLSPKEGTDFKVLKSALPSSSVTIDQKGCRFHPEYSILYKGGTLTVKNSDKGSHNFNYQGTFLDKNLDQSAGQTDKIKDLPSDPQFISFKCDIHAWMDGLLRIADHHAYALTGEDGSFDLNKVPTGDYTLNLRHASLDEAKSIDVTVTKDGKVEGVDLSNVTLKLEK